MKFEFPSYNTHYTELNVGEFLFEITLKKYGEFGDEFLPSYVYKIKPFQIMGKLI